MEETGRNSNLVVYIFITFNLNILLLILKQTLTAVSFSNYHPPLPYFFLCNLLGEFGSVREGQLKMPDGSLQKVAVKMLKGE